MENRKKHFTHNEAEANQEVVTPPELVERIYSHLPEDLLIGDIGIITDCCVGPGALVLPIIEMMESKKISGTLVMTDIQQKHTEDMESYLLSIGVPKEKIENSSIDEDKPLEIDEW